MTGSPAFDAFWVTAALTVLVEFASRGLFPRGRDGKRRPAPVLSMSMPLGLALMTALGSAAYPHVRVGVEGSLWAVLAGAVVLLVFVARSDYRGPSSKRHAAGAVLAAAVLIVGGLGIMPSAVPLAPALLPGGLVTVLATMAWVFLVVAVIEICSLVPLLAPVVVLAIASAMHLPTDAFDNFTGFVLSGVLIGGLLGRMLAEFLRGRARVLEKSEVLLIGYLAAAATLATFLKSMTFAGIVLPVALLTIAAVLIAMQGFEKSILLRQKPRG